MESNGKENAHLSREAGEGNHTTRPSQAHHHHRRRKTSFTTMVTGKRPRKVHHGQLRDGRRMNYIVDGPDELEDHPERIPASGLPVVFAFHGMYLSADSMILHDKYRDPLRGSIHSGGDGGSNDALSRYEYVVIAVHRAGYRGSTTAPPGTYGYATFSRDVAEIADSLEIATFGVVGFSSGGPHALACAALLGPDRVPALATLGSDPEYDQFKDSLPPTCLMDCCIGVWLPRCLRFLVPCLRVSSGMETDYALERTAYPFRTESIQQPAIVVAGCDDDMLPEGTTRKVSDRLPNARYELVPGAGHEGLLKDEILDAAYRTVVSLMDRDVPKHHDDPSWDELPIEVLIRKRTPREDEEVSV